MTKWKWSEHLWGLVFIFVITVLARSFYFWVCTSSYPEWSPEMIPRNGWLPLARSVAAGDGMQHQHLLTYYAVPTAVPSAARGPVPVLLYAGILKLCGEQWYYPMLWLSWCLSGVVACCTYRLTWVVSQSRGLAFASGLVFAGYLSEMYITTTFSVASEPLFSALIAAYLLALIAAVERATWGWAAVAGICLGLACLCRPAVLFLPVVACSWLLWKHRWNGWKPALALGLAFVVTMSPWVARNYLVFQTPLATTTLGGFVLYRHNAMIAENQYTVGYSHGKTERRIREILAARGLTLENVSETEINSILTNEAKAIILQYPLRYVWLSVQRMGWIWYVENSGRGWYAVQNALLYGFALVGLVWTWQQRSEVMAGLLAHLGYFVVIHAAVNVQYRFLCPMISVVMVLAVLGGYSLLQAAWGWRRGTKGADKSDSELAFQPSL